jgi:hypothetical protein
MGWGFAGIVLIGGAREAVRALAWTRTVEGEARLPFRVAFAARLAGEAINTLVPMGMIVGEATKAKHAGRHLGFGVAFRALVIEFAFYTASLPLLFAVAAFAIVPAAAAAIIPVVVALGALAARRVSVPDRARHFLDPMLEFKKHHTQSLWSIGGFEISYHLLAIVEAYVTLALIAPGRASWTSALVLETVNRGVTMVFKMLPMRVGVDEAGAALVARHFDLTSAAGVTVALVRKLRLLVWGGVGLLILLARSSRASAHVPVPTPVRG